MTWRHRLLTAITAVILVGSFLAVIILNETQKTVAENSATPTYHLDTSVKNGDGTIGNQIIANSGTPSGDDLINPILISRSNGDGNQFVYVYNNAGPDSTTRVITVFDELGNFVKNVDLSVPAGFIPKGMTVSEDGKIYLTPDSASSINNGSDNYLAMYYDASQAGVLSPVYTGKIVGFSSNGNLGVPTIDQKTGNVVVAGNFISGGNGYGVEIIYPDGTLVPQIPIWGGDTVYNVVVAPNGDYFAVGRFNGNGKNSDVIKFQPITGSEAEIVANNVSGGGYFVSNWNINGINVDNSGNIYLSGQSGVTATGVSTQQFTIIKIDTNGNFITTVAPYGNVQIGQVGQIQDPGRVDINTDNQAVYVLDVDPATGAKCLKKFVIQLTAPAPPASVVVNPDTGMIKIDPPINNGGSTPSIDISTSYQTKPNAPTQDITVKPLPGLPLEVKPNDLEPCHNYSVSVVARNIIGRSDAITRDFAYKCSEKPNFSAPNTGTKSNEY